MTAATEYRSRGYAYSPSLSRNVARCDTVAIKILAPLKIPLFLGCIARQRRAMWSSKMDTSLVSKTVRLSAEQIAALKQEAIKRRRKFTELIRLAVDDFLSAKRSRDTERKWQ